jgi:DNA-binding LytR/AlgR family response regulator
VHLFLTVPFSLLHVFAMVGIREAVYAAMDSRYNFGNWPREVLYEYRKDFLTYCILVAAIHLFLHLRSRIERGGEADVQAAAAPAPQIVDEATPTSPEPFLSRLLVPHNHREQVVTIDKVQWIEADGNYVKLHTAQGTFRPRMTLASLESRLDPSLFVRIHRSHLVSVSAVKEVQPWFHGDFRIVLASGETLPLSRRFRERLKFG